MGVDKEWFHNKCRYWKLLWQIVHCDIWITESTIESEDFSVVRDLDYYRAGENMRRLIFVFLWHANEINVITISKSMVNRRKLSAGHVGMLSTKSQFRMCQCIHTEIFAAWFGRCVNGIHLRDASVELRNSNYTNLRTHKPKYHNLNDHYNFALCSRVVTSILACTSTTRGNTSKCVYNMWYPLSITHPGSCLH